MRCEKYGPQNIVKIIMPRRMRWTDYVARLRDWSCVYNCGLKSWLDSFASEQEQQVALVNHVMNLEVLHKLGIFLNG
jgi:hypothetical protein